MINGNLAAGVGLILLLAAGLALIIIKAIRDNTALKPGRRTLNEQKKARQLTGILTAAYTCTSCNSPSQAAIVTAAGDLEPACLSHAKAAEQQGMRVIWSMPKDPHRI